MPLIQTDPVRAIRTLEGQHAIVAKLDPGDRQSVEDAQSYLLDDVGRVFGASSSEWKQIWKDNIVHS